MDMPFMQQTMLFKSMTEGEISAALVALHAEERRFQKGQAILSAGAATEWMGLVLEGSVTIESSDLWGSRTILSYVGRGHFFAEAYALLENEPMLVDVIANEACRVLIFRLGGMKRLLQDMEPWKGKLTANLLTICARKNLLLSGRSFHTAPKTIRERVMAYLNAVALKQGSREFSIPFDRQQLADYLNVERSALSKELGKMQKEGLITTRKSRFVLHGTEGRFGGGQLGLKLRT